MEKGKWLIIPIIDACGGMTSNGKIYAINSMMCELPKELAAIEKEINKEILLAPIVFNNGARWVGLSNGHPARLSDFEWAGVAASGIADLGSAYAVLREKLAMEENGGWMDKHDLKPLLLLFLNGDPYVPWEAQFQELKKRGWFKVATKIGVDVSGEEEDCIALKTFTESEESIFGLDCCEDGTIFKLIREICTPIQWVGGALREETVNEDSSFDEFF